LTELVADPIGFLAGILERLPEGHLGRHDHAHDRDAWVRLEPDLARSGAPLMAKRQELAVVLHDGRGNDHVAMAI
jgi:hypothetical protein